MSGCPDETRSLSDADQKIAPGDRRSRVFNERCHEHERRNMPSDLLGEGHGHKRKGEDWPCKSHRRHGDPPPTPGRFDVEISLDEMMEHIDERDQMREAGHVFCDVCRASPVANATPTNQATPTLDTTQASAVATRDNARTTNTNDGEGQ